MEAFLTWQLAPGETMVMIAPVVSRKEPVDQKALPAERNRTIEGQYTDLREEGTCSERARQGDQTAFAEIDQHYLSVDG